MSGADVPPDGVGPGGSGPEVTSMASGPAPMNVLAVLALVFAFFAPVLGPVFGFIALHQIRRTGERGGGLAVAGVVIGIVELVWMALVLGVMW